MKLNFPTLLTLARLVIAPIVLPIMCVYLLPHNNILLNLLVGIIFIFFSLTDLLDGYLARKTGNETKFGRILDFVADKFLIYSTLIGLIAAKKIFFVWGLIFIGREFFVMGVRLLARDAHVTIPVSYWGKIKTVSQVAYIAAAIINPDHAQPLTASKFNMIETGLLVIAVLLTIYSAYRYYQSLLKSIEVLKASHPSESIEAEHKSSDEI